MIAQVFGGVLVLIIFMCIIYSIISYIPYKTHRGSQNKKLLDNMKKLKKWAKEMVVIK